MIEPTFPPVTMNIAITSVYQGDGGSMPVTVVPMSSGGDGHVHDRAVQGHQELPGGQGEQDQPGPLGGGRARLLTASASSSSQPHHPQS